MQTLQERIASLQERINKSQEIRQAQIDALEAENQLLTDIHSMLFTLDIKLNKLRENLQ